MVIAIMGGSFLALAAHLVIFLRQPLVLKLCFVLTGGGVAFTGLCIASLVYRADPGGWRGYLVRIVVSIVCALAIGLWTELCYWLLSPLVVWLLGEALPISNADWFVDIMLRMGFFLPTALVLIAAVLPGKKKG